jgi:hypothetical protein
MKTGSIIEFVLFGAISFAFGYVFGFILAVRALRDKLENG